MIPSPEQEIEEQVITAIRERRDRGRLKYGTTMERQDLTPSDWCQHALEEALDLAIYLQRLKRDLLNDGPATLRQRCEATWDACYTDRRKWADIGEDAQEEWLRVFGHFDRQNANSR